MTFELREKQNAIRVDFPFASHDLYGGCCVCRRNSGCQSIDHEPQTEFEKRAAREIVAGETKIEVIEDGFYRRAGAFPMKGGCLSCHAGFFNQPSKVPKYTGLVISIPIIPESADQ